MQVTTLSILGTQSRTSRLAALPSSLLSPLNLQPLTLKKPYIDTRELDGRPSKQHSSCLFSLEFLWLTTTQIIKVEMPDGVH